MIKKLLFATMTVASATFTAYADKLGQVLNNMTETRIPKWIESVK